MLTAQLTILYQASSSYGGTAGKHHQIRYRIIHSVRRLAIAKHGLIQEAIVSDALQLQSDLSDKTFCVSPSSGEGGIELFLSVMYRWVKGNPLAYARISYSAET